MVVSALDVRNPKPHAEPLEKVLRAFGLHPGEAAYVGDSSVDRGKRPERPTFRLSPSAIPHSKRTFISVI